MNALKQMSAALVLALAGPALAQAPAPGAAWPSAKQQRRAAQGAQPAQPPQGAQPAQPQLSPEQQQAIGAVWYYGQLHATIGDAAAARGSSPDVKKFAAGIEQGYKNGFLPKLAALLQARGMTPASLPRPPDAQQLDQEAKALQARSGADFDGGLVNFWKQHGETFVNALKSAREATAGADPELKKTLDDAEDSEEIYLAEARRLGSVQAQGRTPPAR